jgi:hypothetical protein
MISKKIIYFMLLIATLVVSQAQAFPHLFASKTDYSSATLNPSEPIPDQRLLSLCTVKSHLRPQVLQLALKAYHNAINTGIHDSKEILTIIDYSLASNIPRLWVIDLKSETLLLQTLVAHGRNSGLVFATNFSDAAGTLTSSIGLFKTEETYEGKHGNSLRIAGLEDGFNDKALARGIVIHPASYVSPEIAAANGRVGRSWGCPAVAENVAPTLISTIKGGTLLFAYAPVSNWLQKSKFLNS